MRTWFGLITLMLFCSNGHADQTCNHNSIPASTSNNQLVDNGNRTITDTKTGLMWKNCMEGFSGNDCEISSSITSFNWQEALGQARIVNTGTGFAGYHDWRLPNIKELSSIVEVQCHNPAINLHRFPNTENVYVWSGTPGKNPAFAWWVNFSYGYSGYDGRTRKRQVRLVRGGQ